MGRSNLSESKSLGHLRLCLSNSLSCFGSIWFKDVEVRRVVGSKQAACKEGLS